MKYLKKIKNVNLGGLFTIVILYVFSSCTNNMQKDQKDNNGNVESAAFTSDSDSDDSKFLKDAAEINLEEIKLGQLAQTNAERDDVKELGKMMEEDHTKSLNELKGLASKKSMSIPSSMNDEGNDSYNKLIDKKESDFDKEYVDMMVKGHKDAISKFEKATTDCKDEDIKTWAQKTLPVLKKHLDHAKMCQLKSENM